MKYVYILRSLVSPNQTYIGLTSDLRRRLCDHNSGKCKHTSKFFPWRIVYQEAFEDDPNAFRRERQLKKWTRAKKEALIAGDLVMLKRL